MRCPKCGFISFDQVETCGKCGKDISGEAELLKGTITNIAPPCFLRFDADQDEPEAPESVEEATESETEEVVMDMAGESSREIEFSLGDEPGREAEPDTEEMEMSLGTADINLEEVPGEIDLGEIEEAPQLDDDFTIDLDEEEPKFDFAEIDISDLAPTEKETDNLLVDKSVAEVAVAKETPAEPTARTGSAVLEDLQFEGIDLEAQSIVAQDAAAPGKITPAVKTGTALDSFDVDLDAIFADEKG